MKYVFITILSLISLPAQAQSNENFNFYAENRVSLVFIEKCKLWRQALKDENIELALSFFDPDKVKLKPKYAEKLVRSKIRVLKRYTSKDGYIEFPLRVSKKTQPKSASVLIDWEARNGKSTGGSSCNFDEISPKHWRLN